uniref:hypothetical protein n=1 Tax=Ningiella ruwaisensis TaxID=2364274 RepID=UPI00109F164B|nr:hypothetical protein [Ningiella ruwaisensis]
MRFHDYHLRRYEVLENGKKIRLFLAYGYPEHETDWSEITFDEVVLYNFTHTTYSIITDIEEVSINALASDEQGNLESWQRLYGGEIWQGDLSSTIRFLEKNKYRGWYNDSAIGFHGFVIARCVSGT